LNSEKWCGFLASVLPMFLKGFDTNTCTCTHRISHSWDRPMIPTHHLPSRWNPCTSTMTILHVS